MKQLLKVGGLAGIVLPISILSNTGTYTATREMLLKYFNIVAITELGANTFMATGTNTVVLFLKRRANSDYINVQYAINKFFENYKDVTILGVEEAFSKYIHTVFENIAYGDYISFISRKPNATFCDTEIYKEYRAWFDSQNDVKKLKESKVFKGKSVEEQKKQLEERFYEKVLAIEKDKLLYFLLTCSQKTIITRVGEKQDEKNFLGYEFSNRRGHEGIKLLHSGTKLYDEQYALNPEKANSYVYNAFLNEFPPIDDGLSNNIYVVNTVKIFDFNTVVFEKIVNINSKKADIIESQFPQVKLGDNLIKLHDEQRRPVTKRDRVSGDYPYYGASGVIDHINDYIFDGRYVLLGEDGAKWGKNERSAFLVEGKCWINNHVHVISVNQEKLLDEYLIHILNQLDLSYYITGQNVPKLNQGNLLKIKIPLPPIEIQRKIIEELQQKEKEILESEFSATEEQKNRILANYLK